MKRRFLSPWQCDSDSDYYAQFEEPEYEPDEPEEDWLDDEEGDCEYWESQCYGRA